MGFLDSLFGGDDTVTKTTQSNQSTASSGTIDKSIPSWLQGAAQGNITGLGGMSYTPFSGDRVAGLNPDEVQAGNMIRGLAGTPNAYQSMIEQAYGNAATAAPGQASTTRWYENLGPGGDISAYMDPYMSGMVGPVITSGCDTCGTGAVMTSPSPVRPAATSAAPCQMAAMSLASWKPCSMLMSSARRASA